METFLFFAFLVAILITGMQRQQARASQPQQPRSVVGGVFVGLWLFVISVILLPLVFIALVGGALVK